MDHGHGGDHSYGHAGGGTSYGHVGPGDHHGPGVNGHHAGGGDHGGDHGGFANHDLSIAHAGDFFGHSGSIAFEGLVFMAFLDWAGGHHSHNVGYSFHNSGVTSVTSFTICRTTSMASAAAPASAPVVVSEAVTPACVPRRSEM